MKSFARSPAEHLMTIMSNYGQKVGMFENTGSRPVHLLPGIGPATARWLMEVDVSTEADLRSLGAVAVYCRLKHWNPKRVSLNALWGLYSALTGVPWNQIDTETKARLLAEVGEGRH
jgi:DNA transformation protein and related proteins